MYSGFHKAGSWSLPLSLCLCPEIGGCHRMIEEVLVLFVVLLEGISPTVDLVD